MIGRTETSESILQAALKQLDDLVGGGMSEDEKLRRLERQTRELHHWVGQTGRHSTFLTVSSKVLTDLQIWLTRCRQLGELACETSHQNAAACGTSSGEELSPPTMSFTHHQPERPPNRQSDDGGYASSSPSGSQAKQNLLESENTNMMAQIKILGRQVEETSVKVQNLEEQLLRANDTLIKAEDRLHKEQVNKTYLEAHKLELMSEIGDLRARLQRSERERTELRERYEKVQHEALGLHERLITRDRELSEMRSQLIDGQKNSGSTSGFHAEMERLRSRIDSLSQGSEEKDRKIEELRKAVSKYQRVEEIILQQTSPGSAFGGLSPAVGCGADGESLGSSARLHNGAHHNGSARGAGAFFGATSTPAGTPLNKRPLQAQRSNSYDATKFNRVVAGSPIEASEILAASRHHHRRASGSSGATSPEPRYSSSSLPRDYRNKINGGVTSSSGTLGPLGGGGVNKKDVLDIDSEDEELTPTKEKKKKSGLKKFFARLKRTSSQEAIDLPMAPAGSGPGGAFRRGGVRSTAGPRLGGGAWGRDVHTRSGPRSGPLADPLKPSAPAVPFEKLDSEGVAAWIIEMGLSVYASECRRWVRGGRHLLDCSDNEWERELKMSNFMHRKKFKLALESQRRADKSCSSSSVHDPVEGEVDRLLLSPVCGSANLRAEWVLRWLDDVGLPQYKDAFYEARVDGRVLNYMTVEDLVRMKITNTLHHASIRRAIEVLRQNKFDLSCLLRRPASSSTPPPVANGGKGSSQADATAASTVLWTNHRVIEWLRSIDLSEYAPNLRGSGVHGALMVLEPRFTVELLGQLLNIPPSKSLLRRHLNTHFSQVVGPTAHSAKREAESSSLPLALNAKVKVKRSGGSSSGVFGKSGSKGQGLSQGLVTALAKQNLVCPIESVDEGQLGNVEATSGSNSKEDKKVKDAIANYKKEINKRDRKNNGTQGLLTANGVDDS